MTDDEERKIRNEIENKSLVVKRAALCVLEKHLNAEASTPSDFERMQLANNTLNVIHKNDALETEIHKFHIEQRLLSDTDDA